MKKVDRKFSKQERSWIMYDWANSAYSILAASLLPIYAGVVGDSAGIDAVKQTSDWAFASSISAVIIALSAPILGAIADYRGMRKRLFFVFFALAVISTGLLPVNIGYMGLLLLFSITNLAFAGANVFYDAFLMDVTTPERMDKVSSWGFAMGYVGGSTIPFLISIGLYLFSSDGLIRILSFDSTFAMKLACLITAVWWAVFTIPMLKNVKQVYSIEPEKKVVSKSINRLRQTLSEVGKYKKIVIFLVAYFCYINGVGAIIMMASKIATGLKLDTFAIIGSLMITQLVAFPSSIIYNRLSAKYSSKRMILTGIATYILVCIIGFFMTEEWQFLLLAMLVGTAQGVYRHCPALSSAS